MAQQCYRVYQSLKEQATGLLRQAPLAGILAFEKGDINADKLPELQAEIGKRIGPGSAIVRSTVHVDIKEAVILRVQREEIVEGQCFFQPVVTEQEPPFHQLVLALPENRQLGSRSDQRFFNAKHNTFLCQS